MPAARGLIWQQLDLETKETMKKLFAIAFTVLLAASLSWAQATSGTDTTAEAGKKVTKTSSAKGKTSAESKVALNPQPLPPGAKSKTVSPADKVSLNPQPLPPKERKAGGDPASKVELNPQPLPPGAKTKTVSPADKVSLNPQPLPPKQGNTTATSAESKVALNPQPEPPGVQSSAKKKSSAAGKKVSVPAGSTSKQ